MQPSNRVDGAKYRYRYAIYRGGNFHRFEQPSDGPDGDEVFHHTETPMDEGAVSFHELRLSLLRSGETYIISDVLGATKLQPDIEKVFAKKGRFAALHSLHSRASRVNSFNSLHGKRADSSAGLKKSASKKRVGFKPIPAPYHAQENNFPPKQSVNLDSTDGVVVASAFLPVHVRRSDDGVWSAEWDYEALLSMQTHLRVTRVGIVKWRGWHGNKGSDGSPEGGVPVNEREKVERCLRPFNCVPVWCEPSLFGEM